MMWVNFSNGLGFVSEYAALFNTSVAAKKNNNFVLFLLSKAVATPDRIF
jgi:hypothetical protein